MIQRRPRVVRAGRGKPTAAREAPRVSASRPLAFDGGHDPIDGERDVLGLWVGPTGGEGAKYWAGVLGELRNRGIHDTFIVCCDGLKGEQ